MATDKRRIMVSIDPAAVARLGWDPATVGSPEYRQAIEDLVSLISAAAEELERTVSPGDWPALVAAASRTFQVATGADSSYRSTLALGLDTAALADPGLASRHDLAALGRLVSRLSPAQVLAVHAAATWAQAHPAAVVAGARWWRPDYRAAWTAAHSD